VRLAFAGGGTGGHLFPGLAVAEVAKLDGSVESIVFFGAERGIETRVIPRTGFELVAQPLEGIRGRGLVGKAQALRRVASGVLRARSELRRRRIDVVVGLGGYASSAAVIAARTSGIPVVLLEQNREPGLANGTLARFASVVCTSFEDTAERLPKGLARWTGNPVRAEIEDGFAAREHTRDALLVFGGSAGALSINRAVVAALGEIVRAGSPRLPGRILHQAGTTGLEETRAAYAKLGMQSEVHVDVREFIDDMAGAYAGAKLAVCRAGATTVAELTATGTPSVLVPFPHAAAHQLANARALESTGAAVVVPDDARTAEALAAELGRLLANPETLDSMAAAAARTGRRGAAKRVFDVISEVVAAGRKR
jgi:UDP-N-acetylglucosamine--N-acetylmuramyl-(pentapeptide) pyrophosphoryl-undecaprenol N-acetylglucosamine transferase